MSRIRQITKIFQCASVLLLLTVFAGCAPTGPKLPRLVYPTPPEEPKMEFIGNYFNEGSFQRSGVGKLTELVAGQIYDINFRSPFGAATDGKGTVYISDVHNKAVFVFDFNKKTVSNLTPEPLFDTPAGMDVDSRGRLYIADAGIGKVFVFGSDHKPVFSLQNTKDAPLERPAYIEVNETLGRIYVSDGKLNRIYVYNDKGDYLFHFGDVDGTPGRLYGPQGLAFGPDGDLYIADMFNARIAVYSADGEYLRAFGERGDAGGMMDNPKDIAFDSEGHLYLIDARRADLVVYEPDGTFLLKIGGKPTIHAMGFSVPKSVFIDQNDRIYVAEMVNKRFSIWQYMSQKYLEQNPYTEEDRKELKAYLEELGTAEMRAE